MLRTTATRDGDDYLINGRKWLITGAEGADFSIVMARMEDGYGDHVPDRHETRRHHP
ncbi:acyl-CoA dehydrogenase family protein [Pseudomonas aeruginosa]